MLGQASGIYDADMDRVLKITFAVLMAAPASASAAPARVAAPLYDAVALNIGLNCRWQPRCMADQRKAMQRALGFVGSKHPPAWRVQLCNHNASRGRNRVDWIGFNHCIRNTTLAPLPPPPRPAVRHRRRSAVERFEFDSSFDGVAA
ncbi:MAG: hypothetical protein ABIO80_05380 [Sphingomicrobium sp.]